MLNHTYTSIKNANLVDSGNKQHIASQPSILLKNNFLGEFRTELEKKKVLANLGIVTDLLLEWEFIKGDVGKNEALMKELNTRTSYVSLLDGFQKTLADGLKAIEEIIKGEQDVETEQDTRITELETKAVSLTNAVDDLKTYLSESVDIDISQIKENVSAITEKVNNITELIQVSSKSGNALSLVGSEDLVEGETPGLYVPDLSNDLTEAQDNIQGLRTDVDSILDTYVTKDELGGGDFDFVNQSEYDTYTQKTDTTISDIKNELSHTVKTGEDGHVDTLYVNTISKNNNSDNIKITDSFEVDTGIPLDVRFVKKNIEELCSIPAKICYPGMGVIVQEANALYILRNPEEGKSITQEYVSDIYNWKCPEDLVTTALSRQEYEALEEVNPHIFYYVYEDEIYLTSEPKRENYDSEEEFKIAWDKWTDSLKVLSQEYMSASWGVDIENKLSQKAPNDSVLQLQKEISNIKGSGDGPSLESLGNSITNLESQQEVIETKLNDILNTEENSGKLVQVENSILEVKDSLTNYVSKDELQDESQEFIFVKSSDYEQDKNKFQSDLANEITSEKITATTVSTESISSNEVSLNDSRLSVKDARLNVDDNPLAYTNDLMKVEVIPQTEYDDLEQDNLLNEDTYYYTYGDAEILATKYDLQKAIDRINVLEDKVAMLEAQIKTLLPQE